MSGLEAEDGIQPRQNVRYYRLVRRKTGSYMWAVIIIFLVAAFLCINNYMLLQSYSELKNNLGNAYREIDALSSEKNGLTDKNTMLETGNGMLAEENRKLAEENKNLKEEYTKASRGSVNISKQIELIKKQNNELVKKNKELVDDNIALQNSLKKAASVGVKPQNFSVFDGLAPRDNIDKGKYVGKFLGTAYTPSKDECGNNKGITSSGKPIIPGITVAVDDNCWPYGTVFYIKGLGYAVAMDTGSAIKGKYRFDFSVFDKRFAQELGSENWEVYLVRLGNGIVGDIEL